MPKLPPLPTLVGEQNPYGADPYFALYPAPRGCTGERLCARILGMRRGAYLETFARVNLRDGPWDAKLARLRAGELKARGGAFILLGSKVCAAWGVCFRPFHVTDCDPRAAGLWTALVLPHPSGRNRAWEEPGATQRARAAVAAFLPELSPLLGAGILREVGT